MSQRLISPWDQAHIRLPHQNDKRGMPVTRQRSTTRRSYKEFCKYVAVVVTTYSPMHIYLGFKIGTADTTAGLASYVIIGIAASLAIFGWRKVSPVASAVAFVASVPAAIMLIP